MIRIKKNKELIFAPIITFGILLLIYIVKGVYPFGNASVSYYDMNQYYIPFYTRAHDFLHGQANPIYDWYSGASSRTYSTLPSYMLNPVNLFFFFVPRDRIYESMTLFLALKMTAISFTMAFYLKKVREPEPVCTVTLAVLYAFCGFVVQYYTNIFFLDSVLLLPLIMLGLDELFRNDRGWIYTVFLTLHLIIQSYLCIMVLFFIVFCSAGYLFFLEKRENRRRIAARLGICTAIALAISAVLIYPEIVQWSLSVRTNEYSSSYLDIIETEPIVELDRKMFMLSGSEFAFSALIFSVITAVMRKKKLSRETGFYIFLIVLLIIPIFMESVNLLWHMGSYVQFPFRFAFILTFVMLDYLAVFRKKQPDELSVSISSGVGKVLVILTMLLSLAGMAFLAIMASGFLQYGIHGEGDYSRYYTALLLFIIAGTLAFFVKEPKFRKCYFLAAAVLQSAVAGWGFIAPEKVYDEVPELSGVFSSKTIYDSNMLDQQMYLKNDNLSRVKLAHTILGTNYPLMMERPSLSQWTNEASGAYCDQMKKMGYSSSYTRTIDTGGTVFSDALFNVKKVISTIPLDDTLYSHEQEIAEYNVYDCRYTLPFGILTDERVLSSDFEEEGMEQQNQIFGVFSQTDAPLIKIFELNEYMVSQEETELGDNVILYTTTVEFPVEKDSVLYMYKNDLLPRIAAKKQIEVNGQKIVIPLFDDMTHSDYPEEYNNGIISLGSFGPGKVKVVFTSSSKYYIDHETGVQDLTALVSTASAKMVDMHLGLLDLEELDRLTEHYSTHCVSEAKAEGTSLTMTAEVQDDRYLFLPIEYDRNWRAEVNGAAAEVYPVMNGSFMAVQLPEGHCDIRMKYIPYEMISMIPVSAAGLLLAAGMVIFRRKGYDPASVRIVNFIAYLCFVLLFAGMLLIIYIIPALILANV